MASFRNLNIQINPGRFTHPLQSFPGFEVRQVRFCSMHTINLGILQALNGSSLPLLCSHGCLPVSSFWCTQVVFYCYPMSFLGYLNLYPVLLEYLPWCLAQDFLKMATGWWTILNFEAAVPDSDIGPGSIAMSYSTIGIWGLVIENYILGDGYQTFGAVRGHPKNWFGLLVEDLGRWSSVRRTALQV